MYKKIFKDDAPSEEFLQQIAPKASTVVKLTNLQIPPYSPLLLQNPPGGTPTSRD